MKLFHLHYLSHLFTVLFLEFTAILKTEGYIVKVLDYDSDGRGSGVLVHPDYFETWRINRECNHPSGAVITFPL